MENPIATQAARLRLGDRLRPLRDSSLIVLAVSGGTDSTALLHLVVAWHADRVAAKPILHVLTVDHGLRAEAAGEARQVAAMAAGLGVSCEVLTWNDPKPTTGRQAAARAARYALLEAAAIAHGATREIAPHDIALVTAHTADDQAETMLMRLARDSGPDGLAGMRAMRRLASGVALHRPLLDVPRVELAEFLVRRDVSPIDDPSNADPQFERVRWRHVLAHLAPMGMTGPTLARAARRTATAMDLLDTLIADLPGIDAAIRLDAYGAIAMERAFLARHPSALGARLLARAIAIVGGHTDPVPLAALETALGEATPLATLTRGFTLHGAEIDARGPEIQIYREQRGLPTLACPPAAMRTWDNRFVVATSADAPSRLSVGPLGPDGLRDLTRNGWTRPAGVAAKVLWSQPTIRDDDGIVAAPTLGFLALGGTAGTITATPRVDTILRASPARVAAPGTP